MLFLCQAPIRISAHRHLCKYSSVADPEFSVGAVRGPRRGGVDSQGGYVSSNLYVKMKESGPLGGARAGFAPGSATALNQINYYHNRSSVISAC